LINQKFESENDEKLGWHFNCLVNTLTLNAENWMRHIIPSLDIFSREFSYDGGFEVIDPWINSYSYNGFQEIHTHRCCDMAAVFFVNTGDNFGKFYFYDRLSGLLNPPIEKLIGYNDVIYPEVKPGDIIMFPSNLLHGVKPHKSHEIRKTFAFNFKLI